MTDLESLHKEFERWPKTKQIETCQRIENIITDCPASAESGIFSRLS